ncbi:hexokinase-domain-containing protein [Pilobolus umbonatus]|nr:hexokinase-domain-containing protein [Pilobolus umbonatus]
MPRPHRSFSLTRPYGSPEQTKALEELKPMFHLSVDQLKQFRDNLSAEMEVGLESTGSNETMLPSHIYKHPMGQETGEFIGLELSSFNIKIYLVELHGMGRITTRQQKYTLPEDLKRKTLMNVVEFLAECVDSFLTFVGKYDVQTPLPLGFGLSFPLRHASLNKAYIIQWTKDFEITEYEDKNIGELLQSSLHTHHIPVVVEAVVNNAVGCLLAHSYRSLDTLMACTLRTGTNAAYWEKVDSVKQLKTIPSKTDMDTIINVEWGRFADKKPNLLYRTFYDNRVNRQSVNPGMYIFEKMISGLYMGELVRIIIVDFMDRRLLFDGQYSTEFNTPHSFEVSYLSTITSDDSVELDDIKHILHSIMNLPSTTHIDRQIVKFICDLVSDRAARLTAAAISAVIQKKNALEEDLTISMEGAVYEHFPKFPRRVNDALRSIYGSYIEHINIGITRDGGGIGAAIAAMIAISQKKK